MKLRAAFASVALLAACDGGGSNTLPDGVSGADVALFKAAVADAGCVISDDATASIVEGRTGFDDEKLRAITQYLTLAGESEPATPFGFRLTSGQCENA